MKVLLALLLMLSPVLARASAANAVNLVIDLQSKITQQIKSQIQPVDPDAVVSVNVALVPTDTALLGTQMQAVGLFANGTNQKVDDEDIRSVDVVLMSALDPFPPALQKIIEGTVRGISKKGKLQIVKMDPSIFSAIEKVKAFEKANQDYQKATSDRFDKVATLADDAGHAIPGMVIKILGAIAALQIVLMLAQNFFNSRSLNQLGTKISAIKLEGGGASAPAVLPEREKSNNDKPASSTMTTKENAFKGMPILSLFAVMADCYWCENDAYAAWVWQQLSSDQKIQLLDNWTYAESYCRYLGTVSPQENTFHLDAVYLKPEGYQHLSNPHLLEAVRSKKALWQRVTPMRRTAIPMSLQERVTLLAVPPASGAIAWPTQPSTARSFPQQLDVARLTVEDEETLFANPGMLPVELRKQFPSLVWVALLDTEARSKVLETIPAQSLAEIMSGPEAALQKVREALPEKKRALVDDYAKKARINTESPWLKSISNAALDALVIAEPATSLKSGTETKLKAA